MEAAQAAKIEIDPAMIPSPMMSSFAGVLFRELERIKRDDPEVWAKIRERAEAIREKEREKDGGK